MGRPRYSRPRIEIVVSTRERGGSRVEIFEIVHRHEIAAAVCLYTNARIRRMCRRLAVYRSQIVEAEANAVEVEVLCTQ